MMYKWFTVNALGEQATEQIVDKKPIRSTKSIRILPQVSQKKVAITFTAKGIVFTHFSLYFDINSFKLC